MTRRQAVPVHQEDGWHNVAEVRRMQQWEPSWTPPDCVVLSGWCYGDVWHRPHIAAGPVEEPSA